MRYSVRQVSIEILGDPHLGKVFKNGVPLHRRGERERRQWAEFEASLTDVGDFDIHVCMGDLFDKRVVPPEIELQAAETYRKAAENNPKTLYVVLMGNHDGTRDADQKSSFYVFNELVRDIDNVMVVMETSVTIKQKNPDGTMVSLVFVPWHPFKTAGEMVEKIGSADAVFGHWDIDDYGDDNPNLIPIEALKERTDLVFTGHVHTPEERQYGDLKLIVTGSMQPYSHGEDPAGDTYVTVTLDELNQMDDVSDKCVRLKLKPGEDPPADIDCLQFQVKRVEDNGGDDEDLTVEMETFDFATLFDQVMDEYGLSDLKGTIWSMYQDLRTEDA